MTAIALRRAMARMARSLDDDLAAAFYELLLRTPLFVVLTDDGRAQLTQGPGGQPALPVFLDETALVHWAGAGARGHACTVQEAATVALGVPDAWLVVDLGSSPGGQPVARAGVELLAQGTHMYADRHRPAREFFAALASAMARGAPLDGELRERARDVRVTTVGTTTVQREVSQGVHEVRSLRLLSVRGPEGVPYCAAWAGMAGTLAFVSEEEPRLTLPLLDLLSAAVQSGRGLVAEPDRSAISVPPAQLAEWWQRTTR